MKARKSWTSIGALMLGASVATVAQAQSTQPAENALAAPLTASSGTTQSAPSTTPATGVQAEGEIIVTAQKRAENISRVGISISALSGITMEKQGIKNVADLAHVIPGLTYANSNTNTPVYTLRGVGFYENSLGASPAVSVYVDEVPLPFPVLTTEAGLDLERVEVLKGPQGILFGQNSTGGAINYIAKKPTDRFEAGFDLGYGRFGDATGTAYVSGPISDTLKGRIVVSGERSDDWQYSYTHDDSAGKTRKISGRILLDWKPSDRLRFELNVNGWINKSDPQVGQLIGLGLQNNSLTLPDGSPRDNRLTILENYPLAPHNDRAADWSPNESPIGNERMGQVALRGDWSVTDAVTLTSISSYATYRRHNRADYDGIVPNNDDLQLNSGTIRSFIQEVRLANNSSSRLRWLVGGNFESSRANETDALFYHDSTIADVLNNLAGLPGGAQQWETNPFHTNQKMKNYAGFANAEFDITRQLTVKAGARYTEADRTADACTNDSGDGRSSAVFNFLNGITSLKPGSCYTVIQTLDAQGNVVGITPIDNFHDTLNQHNVSWRAGIDYKPNSRILFYGNIAKGYKAGGYPAASAVVTDQYKPVVQESVLSYETGFKVSSANHVVDLTGAVYYYDYTNKQLRAQGIYLPFGILNNLQNIPKSDVKGAELELVVRPVTGLRLDASGSFNDAKVKRYVGINANGTFGNFAGAKVPFTPKWSVNAAADYSFSLSPSLNAFLGTSLTYRSSASGAIGGEAIEKINSYALLDLRAGVESPDGNWRVQAWAKNVTNKYYWTNVVHTFDTIIRYTGRPATYGMSLSYRFR